MDNYQINSIMHCVRKDFLGTFAIDKIPKNMNSPYSFIANTDPSDKPGQHWVAVRTYRNEISYFDSYGLAPVFIFSGSYNTKQVQDCNTKTCGEHCIYFLCVQPL